jgi:hopene-associated glycosyltransferase HpnB
MIALFVAALSCALWLYLVALRGRFWRAPQLGSPEASPSVPDGAWPRVVAIVPARDEAAFIDEAVLTLLRQDYRGALDVVVVDDHSSDHTADVVRATAALAGSLRRVSVLAAPSVPDGWSGKLWAVHHGIGHAQALAERADYWLLADADIRFADDTLAGLMERTLRDRLVLTSVMAKLRCSSWAERLLVPAFVFFFQMLYPFAWVNRRDRSTAAAAGGCMLMQAAALESAGGIQVIRRELIDDCALARALKPHGGIWLGLSERVHSVRPYQSLEEFGHMVRRCAYAQLRYSPWWLMVTVVAMAVIFLAPPAVVLVSRGLPLLLATLAWAGMALAMQPTLRFYGLSAWWALLLPAVAAIYLVFTLESAWQHARGRGGQWKGRTYPRGFEA